MSSTSSSEPGFAVFADIFRRADKNDDGEISLEEFRVFFRDGVLTAEEIDALFHAIDTDKNLSVDCTELSNFFRGHWGKVQPLFGAIEGVNKTIADVLNGIAASYDTSDHVSQFTTRFLLREIVSQFDSIQSPIVSAHQTLFERTLAAKPAPARSSEFAVADATTERGRRVKNQQSTQALADGNSHALQAQVDRLAALLGRLEGKVAVTAISEEDTDTDTVAIVLFKRDFVVLPDKIDNFRKSLQTYHASSSEEEGFLHFYTRHSPSKSQFTLYEIWDSDKATAGHFAGRNFRHFQRANIEALAAPETSTRIELPASWWVSA
ncbi:hypothetical protein CAOG_06000 [Capsaspora owczarzaki ATCC 30864]|uniref:ABM domain-containing protein n=1 Tax=Capsaspora owczarzaki (strain ATCC 30864) TaxID=595528 RepID=A0A0D2VVP2_CAPO3|nr:hypothetical protein CAOG_06000 [Capsaspora owczarzaki ATCC 30864]KJE95557.1 hypothetical protein CAOG_006000 [Capsaspora owczarzaki ATCC 30864]|eukprot:XP_004345590.1 hypothetical protein CAOG_06000 [Capsaspora owczarzaki ATCC 30864]